MKAIVTSHRDALQYRSLFLDPTTDLLEAGTLADHENARAEDLGGQPYHQQCATGQDDHTGHDFQTGDVRIGG